MPGDRALTALQINYARAAIEDRKQLKDTSMAIVWPFLRYICCCCFRGRRTSFNGGLKKALRRRMDLKISKSDERIEQDPYLLLGYGMNSYFEIMLSLMCMMLIVAMFAIPLMVRFSQFSALAT